MSMNYRSLVGGNKEGEEDRRTDSSMPGQTASPAQGVQSRQRTIEAGAKRESHGKSESNPKDKAPRKPPLGSSKSRRSGSRKSGSRKRMKEARKAEKEPDDEDLGMK